MWHIKSQGPFQAATALSTHTPMTLGLPEHQRFLFFENLTVSPSVHCLSIAALGLSSSTDHPNSEARVERSLKSCSRLNVRVGAGVLWFSCQKLVGQGVYPSFLWMPEPHKVFDFFPQFVFLDHFLVPVILPTTFPTHLLLPSTFGGV